MSVSYVPRSLQSWVSTTHRWYSQLTFFNILIWKKRRMWCDLESRWEPGYTSIPALFRPCRLCVVAQSSCGSNKALRRLFNEHTPSRPATPRIPPLHVHLDHGARVDVSSNKALGIFYEYTASGTATRRSYCCANTRCKQTERGGGMDRASPL